jgi:hypothetical protein
MKEYSEPLICLSSDDEVYEVQEASNGSSGRQHSIISIYSDDINPRSPKRRRIEITTDSNRPQDVSISGQDGGASIDQSDYGDSDDEGLIGATKALKS